MKTPTSAQFETALADCSKSSTALRVLEAKRTVAIAKTSAKFASDIEELQSTLDTSKDVIRRYATAEGNRASVLPAGGKSLSFHNVELGWKIPPPSLRLLEGYTWDSVQELVEKKIPDTGLRTTVELDKNALKAFAQESPANAKKLAACGMELGADETFFIKVK